MTCAKDVGTHIYIYCKKARLIYRSTATAASGAVLKSKRYDHMTYTIECWGIWSETLI